MAGQRHATLFKRGKVYYVSYYRDGKLRQESTHTSNPKIAEEVRRRREREMFDGTEGLERDVIQALRDPAKREALIGILKTRKEISSKDAFEEYVKFCGTYKGKNTLSKDKNQISRTLNWIGVTFLSEVTSKLLIDYVSYQVTKPIPKPGVGGSNSRNSKPWQPSSVQRWRETAHHFFGWAVNAGYIPNKNPVDLVPRPKLAEKTPQFLNAQEIVECLEEVAGSILEMVIAAAIFSGLRRDELCWLTWDDVLLDQRSILVREKTIGGVKWTPKTKRNRTVKFEPRLVDYLRRQKLKAGKSIWVFPSPKGCRWNPDNLSTELRELSKGRWNFNLFRHTYGSSLAIARFSAIQISQLLGNSEKVCRKHYIGLLHDEMVVEFLPPVVQPAVEG